MSVQNNKDQHHDLEDLIKQHLGPLENVQNVALMEEQILYKVKTSELWSTPQK